MLRPASFSRWLFVVVAAFGAGAADGAEPLPFCDTLEQQGPVLRIAPDEVRPPEAKPGDAKTETRPEETAREASAPAAEPGSFEARLRALEEANAALKERVRELEADNKTRDEKLTRVTQLSTRFGAFVDAGFFWVAGNGTGIRNDIGNVRFPQYDYIPDSWVFLGDPLSTQINSRGDVADTGESRAVTTNDIGNGGKASFILNSLNLNLFAGLDPTLTVTASVDFVPRVRNASVSGKGLADFIDVRYVYAEYIAPIDAFALSVFVGKFDPVLGMEYRSQDAPDRLTVTPSLICRYTCGRQTGLKARAKFFKERLNVAVAATNGSAVTEQFPFGNSEVDYNNFKTASGRLGVVLPVGAGWELGVSGSFGAQDLQPADNVYHWHVGADMRFSARGFEFTAEYVRGRANGKTEVLACDIAPCLTYQGAYGLIGYQFVNWLTPYVRVDWREATHLAGASFAYIGRMVRVTGGLRFEIGQHVLLKMEYVHAREVGGMPAMLNDIATSSFVARY